MYDMKNTIIHMLCVEGTQIKDVEKLIRTYGKNIEQADGTIGKEAILILKEVIDADNEKTLNFLHEKYINREKIDLEEIKNELKQYFGKKLMTDLYKPKEENLIPQEKLPEELKEIGVPVYDAGTDFRMVLSARGDGINR